MLLFLTFISDLFMVVLALLQNLLNAPLTRVLLILLDEVLLNLLNPKLVMKKNTKILLKEELVSLHIVLLLFLSPYVVFAGKAVRWGKKPSYSPIDEEQDDSQM
jgi:hypothetical protein